MTTHNLKSGIVHQLPKDLRSALQANQTAAQKWDTLTPLARNEWICWVISPKRDQTRQNHVERTVSELVAGSRRPCCWVGCIHRTDKAVSPSVKTILKL